MNNYAKILIGALLVLAFAVEAQIETVEFPVAELGGCESEEACKIYCDKSENIEKCIAFAEAHNLIGREEIARGKKFAEILKEGGGPGGCKSERSCEEYCNNIDHIDRCVAFAEENGFMDEEDLAEAKKVREALKRGSRLPGGCKNKTACEAYCKNAGHIDECFAFAKENGLISEEELDEAERMIPLIKRGETPGGCRSKEECEAFCEAEENLDRCIEFAAKNGLISGKELEIMRKTGGRGPGGCRGRACATFCEKPGNRDVCFNFAKENNLIGKEELKKMEEGMKFMRESLENADPKVKECVEKIIGAPGISGGDAGRHLAFGGPEIGEKMRECFEQILPTELHGEFKFEGTEVTGPGGCSSHEECEAYCRANPDTCGIKREEFIGPGGCRTREECEAFCRENPDKCGVAPIEGTRPDFAPPDFKPPPDQGGIMPAPPEFHPPENDVQFREQFREQYQQQYEEQYRQQFEQQYREQYQAPAPTSFDPRQNPFALLLWPVIQLLLLDN